VGLFDDDTPRMTRDEFWREYRAYVNPKNLYWKRKCLAVKRRAHRICERCHKRPLVHVHHLTYERFKHELLEDLIGLCLECHQAEHPDKELTALPKRTVSSTSRTRYAYDSTEWTLTGRAVTVYFCHFCKQNIKIGQPGLVCKTLNRRLHVSCWDAHEQALRKDRAL
jgi:hypothetical protein